MTRDQQIINLIFAAWRWNETAEDDVVYRLLDWRCGTQACFGGHLVTWPEFQAMGVHESAAGAPCMRRGLFSSETSWALFGDLDMFDTRSTSERGGSDHAIIAKRLEAQFVRLTSEP